MSGIDSQALLAVWERTNGQNRIRRALTLLGAARPERSAEEWSLVPIGERDAALLDLRESLFGEDMAATAACPQCSEKLDMTISTRQIQAPALTRAEADRTLTCDGVEISWRLPTSADLLASAGEGRAGLIRRCTSVRAEDGLPFPESAANALAAAMSEADPLADIQIALVCPACRHAWQSAFDIVSYLWTEIDDWAQRLLLDVHTLASAYGWSERDIVGLSPTRRQFYLDVLGA